MSDRDLPEEEQVLVRRIQQHLWRMLAAVVDEMKVGVDTFRPAEMLLALGIVGKGRGWF